MGFVFFVYRRRRRVLEVFVCRRHMRYHSVCHHVYRHLMMIPRSWPPLPLPLPRWTARRTRVPPVTRGGHCRARRVRFWNPGTAVGPPTARTRVRFRRARRARKIHVGGSRVSKAAAWETLWDECRGEARRLRGRWMQHAHRPAQRDPVRTAPEAPPRAGATPSRRARGVRFNEDLQGKKSAEVC